MRQTFQLILYVAVATVLTAGCTGKRSQTEGESDWWADKHRARIYRQIPER